MGWGGGINSDNIMCVGKTLTFEYILKNQEEISKCQGRIQQLNSWKDNKNKDNQWKIEVLKRDNKTGFAKEAKVTLTMTIPKTVVLKDKEPLVSVKHVKDLIKKMVK